jgi:molecular chaperone HscB
MLAVAASPSTFEPRAVVTTFNLDFTADHFALFGIERAQGIDTMALEARFREIQAEVHPDKHTQGSDANQRLAMQWATRVNEAYQTLKSPLARARYLLQLQGHDAQIESNTAMPMDFLVAQMELREAVAEAKVGADDTVLDGLRHKLVAEMKEEYRRLQDLIDAQHDYVAAAGLVRQLMFQEKLLTEIDDALEAVFA